MKIIVVSGALANLPLNGGNAWTRLNWVLGFKRLGFDVYFIEQIGPEACIDAAGAAAPFELSVNRAYFQQVVNQFGLSQRAALIYADGQQIDGLQVAELRDLSVDADLLVNIGGHLSLAPLLQRFRCKAFVDDDPGFTQFWSVSGTGDMQLDGYDAYFTFGQNIGTSECCIPTCGIHWRTTRPPVVLEEWPMTPSSELRSFTTVASWRGPYGPVEFGDVKYGLKVHQFRRFIELPARVSPDFEIALDIHAADQKDRRLLEQNHWRIVDPKSAVPDPCSYRRYVQRSEAEFSVAKGIYVQTGSGWFSDRTACYLASGKPAVVQDTGFSGSLSTMAGLMPFRNMEEAIAAVEAIGCDYERHRRAARVLAEAHFDSNRVLGQLIEESLLAKRNSKSSAAGTIR